MGNCGGGESNPEERKRLQKLKEGDANLSKAARSKKDQEDRVAKLLLLGTGESGKSTIYRQMIKLFGKGFQEDLRTNFKSGIHQQIIQAVLILIKENVRRDEAKDPNYQLGANAKEALKWFQTHEIKGEDRMTPGLATAIKTLWDDPAFKLTFERRLTSQISESTEYFLNNLERVAKEDYMPTDDDLLLMRVKTSGIVQEDFQIEQLKFRLCDVGGQRNERRKWIHCFDEVTAVIFVTAISEYDQLCYEDEETNRMIESLNLFEELANSRWFVNTAMILFLNKQDLFDKKFETVPLTTCFKDWSGNTKEEAYEFIKEKFTSRLSRKRDIFSHVTNATDSDNIYKVFHAVRHIVVKAQLSDGGFL